MIKIPKAAIEAGARAYVRWVNPAHSLRVQTETDRQLVRAILAAALTLVAYEEPEVTIEEQDSTNVQICMNVPEGSVVIRSIEVVQFLSPDGQEVVSARWQGPGNVIAELGMMEYAKHELVAARFYHHDDPEEPG